MSFMRCYPIEIFVIFDKNRREWAVFMFFT